MSFEEFEEVESGHIKIRGQKLRFRITHGMEGLNGYVTFPKRPVREEAYEGILLYVGVHGGITYADELDNGEMEYGFDTVHYRSEDFPRDDPKWILGQIRLMAESIIVASEVEDAYLRCKTNMGKAKHVQKVRDVAGDNADLSFGAMINMLGGKI